MQAAVLLLLTRACILGAIKKITVYTDNRYGLGNLDSIIPPQAIAVCKCEAHTKAHDCRKCNAMQELIWLLKQQHKLQFNQHYKF